MMIVMILYHTIITFLDMGLRNNLFRIDCGNGIASTDKVFLLTVDIHIRFFPYVQHSV